MPVQVGVSYQPTVAAAGTYFSPPFRYGGHRLTAVIGGGMTNQAAVQISADKALWQTATEKETGTALSAAGDQTAEISESVVWARFFIDNSGGGVAINPDLAFVVTKESA